MSLYKPGVEAVNIEYIVLNRVVLCEEEVIIHCICQARMEPVVWRGWWGVERELTLKTPRNRITSEKRSCATIPYANAVQRVYDNTI